jgi:hypothetical protein
MNKTAAVLMIICSTVLMQWHSIDFWRETTGDWSGAAWSIGLEAAMLWFWFEGRRWSWLIKYIAALLLVAGPWYQITGPTVESLYRFTVTQAKIETAQERVAQLSASLIRYETNSAGRTGWARRIDKTQTRLDEARERRASLQTQVAEYGAEWRGYAVVGMQALALLVILTAQLAAVTSLRNRNGVTVTKRNTPKRNGTVKRNVISERTPEGFDEKVESMADTIRFRLSDFGSQAKMAKQLDIRPANITAVLNHKERKESGGETISPTGLEKIVDALGIG